MSTLHAAGLAVAVCLLASCGGSAERVAVEEPVAPADREAAVGLVQDVDRWVNTGNFRPYWRALHPAHQSLITEDSFVKCWETGILGISDAFELLEVARVRLNRDEVPETNGIAVTFYRTGTWEDGERYEETLTRDVVSVDGRWRYLLAAEFVEDLHDQRCPVSRFQRIDTPE